MFPPKLAIPLSNVTILGSSIMNMFMNANKRHPKANRPLIDWDLILVMEPLTIGGAVAGSFINKLLPEWLLVISLVLLLGYTPKRTLEKGFKTYAKETKEIENSSKRLNRGIQLSELNRQEIDEKEKDNGQMSMFDELGGVTVNDCEGMCGV